MSGVPRWQIWMPRLAFVGVLLLAAQYSLGLLVRSSAIRTTEAAIGARAHIGSSRVSLLDRKVVLNDLQLADSRCPVDVVLEADRCELELAQRPLLQKQAVVTHGRLSGLRFSALGGERVAQSGEATTSPAAKWFRDDSDAVAQQWFARLAARFKHDQLDQLESVQRTEALCANWSNESARLEARGNELNERMASLQKALDTAQLNPLRGEKLLANVQQTVADLQQDFAELNADLARLPDRLDSERRAIVAARRQDEVAVRKRVTLEPVEANALSSYLLRAQAAKPLGELIGWLRWLRESSPDNASKVAGRWGNAPEFATGALPQPPSAGHTRGENILFAGCRQVPDVLIQVLDLRGAAKISGQPVELRGTLAGLSTQPALADEPIRLRLEATGSMPLELQATFDRTHGAMRDAILVDCQGILLPQLELGQSDQLTIAIAPSLGSLSVSLAVDGEKLTGEIQMVQQNVRITPTLAGGVGDAAMSGALADSLGHLESLATRASIGGTLTDPTCTLWSNLGPAVAEAIERAIERASGQHARAVLAEAGRQVDERLTTVERQMSEQQTRWSSRFADVRGQLQTVAANSRRSNERIGLRLPRNSLLR